MYHITYNTGLSIVDSCSLAWGQSFQRIVIDYSCFGLDKSWFHNMSAGETIILSHNAPKHLTSCKVDTPKVKGMLHISNPSNPSTDYAK